MDQDRIEVVDREGWRRVYPLQKSIIHIGSAPGNDIILENQRGNGVNPRHIQLIARTNHQLSYQLINLSDTEILLGESGEQALAPRGVTQLVNGDTFYLGEFALIFYAGTETNIGAFSTPTGSGNIGLNISLPQRHLSTNQSIDGYVKLKNLGQQAAQFELTLTGLDDACYDLEPGPLLGPGAQLDVLLRLHHRGSRPMAGDLTFTVRASAPKTYAEEKEISQTIRVLPDYRHKLRLLDPKEKDTQQPQIEDDLLAPKAKDSPLPQRQVDIAPQITTPSESATLWADQAAATPATQPSALKIEAQMPPPASEATPAEISQETTDLWAAAPPPSQVSPPPQTEVSSEAADLWAAPSETEPQSTTPAPTSAEQSEVRPETPLESEPPQPKEADREIIPETPPPVELPPPAAMQPVDEQIDDQSATETTSPPEPEPELPSESPEIQPQPFPPIVERPDLDTEIEIPPHSKDQLSDEVRPELAQAQQPVQTQEPANTLSPVDEPTTKREMGIKGWWGQFSGIFSRLGGKSPASETESDLREQQAPEPVIPAAVSTPQDEVQQPPAEDNIETIPPQDEVQQPPAEDNIEAIPQPDEERTSATNVLPAELAQESTSPFEEEIPSPYEEAEAEVEPPSNVEQDLAVEIEPLPQTAQTLDSEAPSPPAEAETEFKPEPDEPETPLPVEEATPPAVEEPEPLDRQIETDTTPKQQAESSAEQETTHGENEQAEDERALDEKVGKADTATQDEEPTMEADWFEDIEDLWTTDVEPETSIEKKQVLKLKAGSAPASRQVEEVQPDLSPDLKDLWTAEASSETETQKQKTES